MPFITIYVTNASESEAKNIAEHLLQKKMIACANLYPIQSVYWWKGYIQKDTEWVALLKTTSSNWEKVRDEIKRIHPYEVPCIMKTVVQANEAYEKWIEDEVK
ncbi:MAG TPA: divalent-cation tolerance protein CutA [Phaeodactylibacter sp.]|nr:divalent-cation tolerance protein CutA [Phaeodactylibacter sp.]